MAIERIWDIQGFSGGESDDITRWPKDSFYSAENVDIRTDLSGARLSAELIDTGWSIVGNVTLMQNLETIGLSGILVCTDAGNMYVDGVLKHTWTQSTVLWNSVIGIGSITVGGTRYVYYISQTSFGGGVIHKSNIELNTFTPAYKSYSTASVSSGNTVVLNYAGGLIFSKANKIFKMSVGEVVTEALVLPAEEITIGFTQFQNNYKIYANFGTSGIQYLWDWSSTFPDYRQVWNNQPIRSVTSDGAYDYAITGFSEAYARLILVAGTQKQDLRVNLEASDYSRLFSGGLTTRNGVIYIIGGKTGESTNWGVFTYGSYYANSPKSLVQEYSLSTNRFLKVAHSSSNSYFANADGKVYVASHNNPPSNASKTGYIATQVYEGNIWEEKTLKRIRIGFKLEIGSRFRIYLRTDIGETWLLAKTVGYEDYTKRKWVTINESEIKSLNLGNFTTLQYKIELVSGYSPYPSSSPIIKRITTFMEVTNANG